MSTKRQWPEVVGKTVEEAKAIISKDRPDVFFEVFPVDSAVTEDYCDKRCRLFVDGSKKVAHAPSLA
jgi:hypothetical protein